MYVQEFLKSETTKSETSPKTDNYKISKNIKSPMMISTNFEGKQEMHAIHNEPNSRVVKI